MLLTTWVAASTPADCIDKAIYCWRAVASICRAAQGTSISASAMPIAKKGDREQARRHMLTDLRLNPGRTQTLLDLGELLVTMGRLQEADEKFRRAIELAPGDPGGYYHHGRLLLRMNRDDEAASAFSTAFCISIRPSRGAHMGLGRISFRRGDTRRRPHPVPGRTAASPR